MVDHRKKTNTKKFIIDVKCTNGWQLEVEEEAKRIIVTTEIISEMGRWKNGIFSPDSIYNKDISCMSCWQKSTLYLCFITGFQLAFGFSWLYFQVVHFYMGRSMRVVCRIACIKYSVCWLCESDTIICLNFPHCLLLLLFLLFVLSHLSHRWRAIIFDWFCSLRCR